MLKYTFNEERLAQRIRKFRDEAGLSQRALADLCSGNISAATISRIENKQAKSYSDLQTLLPILGACGIDIKEIIESQDSDGKAQIDNISAQLRVSKNVSTATLQALETIIRAVQAEKSQPHDA